MNFRLAKLQDLPQLKTVYRDIIKDMNNHQIQIWDDIYPCEFFEQDIISKRLYLLLNNDDIVSAFAVCNANAGEQSLIWKNNNAKALYLDRLGVNVNYTRKGIGSFMLTKAQEAARALDADYLRLFVVDINEPAIQLYTKNGFSRADGIYNEIIEKDFILQEYGYEIRLS